MTPPCPAPAGMRWVVLPADGDLPTAGVLVSDAGVHIVASPAADAWTLYDAAGTILRDGVAPDRLPAAILALLDVAPTE